MTPIDAIGDVKDLMFWLRKNADSLKIKENKIATSGWSVGAQLCATLAIFPDTIANSKISSVPDAILLTSPGTGTGGWFTELLNGEKDKSCGLFTGRPCETRIASVHNTSGEGMIQ